jgi:hypothetical protein
MSAAKPRQSFGKRFAKIVAPVLIGIQLPFLAIQMDSLLNPIDLDKAGKGAMLGSQMFDYVVIPTLLFILVIIQWIIIVPLWNAICSRFRYVFFSSLCIGITISVLLGILFGYLTINDQSNSNDLINAILLMGGFITAYCIVNIITLYLLDRYYIAYFKSQKLRGN